MLAGVRETAPRDAPRLYSPCMRRLSRRVTAAVLGTAIAAVLVTGSTTAVVRAGSGDAASRVQLAARENVPGTPLSLQLPSTWSVAVPTGSGSLQEQDTPDPVLSGLIAALQDSGAEGTYLVAYPDAPGSTFTLLFLQTYHIGQGGAGALPALTDEYAKGVLGGGVHAQILGHGVEHLAAGAIGRVHFTVPRADVISTAFRTHAAPARIGAAARTVALADGSALDGTAYLMLDRTRVDVLTFFTEDPGRDGPLRVAVARSLRRH